MQRSMTATPSQSGGRIRFLGLVRTALGTGQAAAACTAMFLLETGMSRSTAVAFTVTTVLLCTSLFMTYLGIGEGGGRQ